MADAIFRYSDSVYCCQVINMPIPSDLDALVLKRDQLKSQLAQIGEMRPGSLVARFPQMWQAFLPLRQEGRPSPRPFLFPHSSGGG